MSEGLIIIQYCTDLVGLTMGSDSAEVFGQVFEGLVVVLWQCVQQALQLQHCLLYTSPSPRDPHVSRMPSSA